MLVVSAAGLGLFSFINLIFHIAWRREVKRCFTKIIYKDELRKEISLRMLSKTFTFKLI